MIRRRSLSVLALSAALLAPQAAAQNNDFQQAAQALAEGKKE